MAAPSPGENRFVFSATQANFESLGPDNRRATTYRRLIFQH